MSIGAGMFLMTVGAIIAFALRDRSDAVNLNVVGVVIMLAGAAGIWLSFYITNRRRRVETQALDPVVEEEYRTVEETAAQHGDAPVTARPTTPPRATSWPISVTRKPRTKVAQTTVTATERRIELDPAASGLHTPTPDRTAPMPSPAATPSPTTQEPHSVSWHRRLRTRFDRH